MIKNIANLIEIKTINKPDEVLEFYQFFNISNPQIDKNLNDSIIHKKIFVNGIMVGGYSITQPKFNCVSNQEVLKYLKKDSFCWLQSIYIDEEYREQGHATILIEDLFFSEDQTNIALLVNQENHIAIQFFEKMAFEIIKDVFNSKLELKQYLMIRNLK